MNAVTSARNRPGPPGSYYDGQIDAHCLKLLPAEYRASDQDVAIVTLLGSCVAACLYDPLLGAGGMNHFMLPDGDGQAGSGSARYGAHAMELLINDILKLGGRRQHLVAKVFGGGNVLAGFNRDPVGTRNSRFIMEYLQAERIQVAAQDLGDIHARKVCFFPRTGRTLVKHLPPTRQDEVVREERIYRHNLVKAPASGGVELF